ncbi:MAG: nucleotidyl transferase AbiEii/AbiGii toxin family protein [Parabacteroides sp.]|jgi:predicted nucleotidyltransferase component of viral defense system|nr:nucleotidyl transferase AbiEii/AbiGii toxin family protein [Parabacteroides sp.]MDD2416657.1 nucleotidyl transferase AbiEii/AbiGii toxin family protein [Parabacteroides sp.]MDD4406136.1 nucleotidyl transferase AbiEii/AbiGii toxin family protein [Parabacteroides sp.]
MKNRADSIRARLLNLAKKERIDFQLIIIRFLHERLLYRISVSDYSQQLILKGGAFIYAVQGIKSRPTIDVDLLGTQISNDIETLCGVFRQICTIESEDEVAFNPKSVVGELITQQDKYNGVRLYIDATFHTVKQRIQIDVGFGDIVIPVAQELEYPILLDEMQIPVIQAYSTETVIAEKFQAMIELSVANSRMKDFYDVYNLLTDNKFDNETLEEAIKVTFVNRGTSYTENHALFTAEFGTNPQRKKSWTVFLNKINRDKELEFEDVMRLISEKLMPFWAKM